MPYALKEKVENACFRVGISKAELARQFGISSQSLNRKLDHGLFSVDELKVMESYFRQKAGCRERDDWYVLQHGQSYSPEWFTKEKSRKNGWHTTNILHGDRYDTEEEAKQHLPDDTWHVVHVTWFQSMKYDFRLV